MLAVRALLVAYQSEFDFDLCFQQFPEELAALPGPYAGPKGRLWLAEAQNSAVGCVAVKPLEPGICELKRLYVTPECRSSGLGKQLMESAIQWSAESGYRSMRLDTLARMVQAISLYRSLGFREISPYTVNPLDEPIFLELDLHVRYD